MTKNGIIITHFGANTLRIKLMSEVIERLLLQKGKKRIYIVENLLPTTETKIPENILENVTHVRIVGNPALWQKEGSYNAGAKLAFGDHCDNLVFMDSDMIPDSKDWLKKINEKLKTYDWVHGGKRVFYLTKFATKKIIKDSNKETLDDSYKQKKYVEYKKDSAVYNRLRRINSGFPGGAWAVNRKAWKLYSGWDLYGIIGGGDTTHFLRLLRMHNGETKKYGNIRKLLYNPLLDRYFRTDPKWNVSYIDSNIYHMWHGAASKRAYTKRYKCLVKPGHEELLNVIKPQFKKEQLIDFNQDVRINSYGLVELNEKSKYFKWFLKKFTEYFISRKDANTVDVNNYLDYISADFRLAEREDGNWKIISLDEYKKIKKVIKEVKEEEKKTKKEMEKESEIKKTLITRNDLEKALQIAIERRKKRIVDKAVLERALKIAIRKKRKQAIMAGKKNRK